MSAHPRSPATIHLFVAAAFCLVFICAVIVHIRESPVDGGDVRSGSVELLASNNNNNNGADTDVDADEQQDVSRAKMESDDARVEMAKSKVVQAEAALDEAQATVTNVAARVHSAQRRMANLKKEISKQEAAQKRIAAREAKIRKVEAVDNTATTNLGEVAGSHAANIPLLLARVPAEKKEIKSLQKRALKMRRSALTLEEKHAELQQSTVSTLTSSISQEEDAQTQFALAKADLARAKAKEIEAAKEAAKGSRLTTGVDTLANEAKAAKLRYQLANQENDAKTDAVRALKLKVASLKSRMTALVRRTQVQPMQALNAVKTNTMLPALPHETAKQRALTPVTSQEASVVIKTAQDERRGRGVGLGNGKKKSAQSTQAKLRELAEEADQASAKAAQYRKQLQMEK